MGASDFNMVSLIAYGCSRNLFYAVFSNHIFDELTNVKCVYLDLKQIQIAVAVSIVIRYLIN